MCPVYYVNDVTGLHRGLRAAGHRLHDRVAARVAPHLRAVRLALLFEQRHELARIPMRVRVDDRHVVSTAAARRLTRATGGQRGHACEREKLAPVSRHGTPLTFKNPGALLSSAR